jgi:nicotinamide mononucleotide (NMN) deamidase PncC
VDGASRRTITRTLRLPGQRDQMRQMSVISALDLLRRALLARPGAAGGE